MKSFEYFIDRKIFLTHKLLWLMDQIEMISEFHVMVLVNGLYCTPRESLAIYQKQMEEYREELQVLESTILSFDLEILYDIWNHLNEDGPSENMMEKLECLINLIEIKEGERKDEKCNAR